MNKRSIPSYIKYFFILGNIVLTGFLVVMANTIVAPLLAAFIVAILLTPFSAKFERLGLPRALSALLLVFLFFLLVLLFLIFFSAQIANITSDMPLTYGTLEKLKINFQYWVSDWLNISLQQQINIFNTYIKNLINNIFSNFTDTLTTTANYLLTLLLFAFSLFFFLYYRSFFITFIYKLSDEKNSDKVKVTLQKIQDAVNNYIVGLFFVIITVSVLNVAGLLVLGIRHAIFFGIFGALLTIFPYIGIIIGSLIPAFFALVTTDSIWYPVGVLFIFAFVQFLEGNFITPIIVGSQVNLNPYLAILGLFIGGMLLGPIGVVLAIPLLGIAKIICDQVDVLKPFGFVLGKPKESLKLDNYLLDFMNYLSSLIGKFKK